MRGARPFIVCSLAALAVSGCIGRTAPVAMVPQASLDTIAYGQASAPMAKADAGPVRSDSAYHLDAGDKLRVVVYGQEGLTNTYAIDAGGSITMPLIGPARRAAARPRDWPPKSPTGCATALSASLRSPSKLNPIVRPSSSAKWRRPANIPMYRT